MSFCSFSSQFVNVSYVSILTISDNSPQYLSRYFNLSQLFASFVPVCHKVSIYHSFFFNCVEFSTNLFHLPQNVHNFFRFFTLFSCPITRTVFKLFKFKCSSCTVLSLRFDSSLEFNICHRFHNLQRFQCLLNTRSQNWILSKNKSRQKWAHQSESICIYFLGFISLICYRDLYCFNSFIICNWLG